MVEARQAAWAPELKRKLELMPASSALPGSTDRDFGALGDLLEALLVASRCPRDLQSLKI